MDILAICGSPRKNKTTHSMLKAVLDGAGLPYELLWPAFMHIGHCVGCRKCKLVTPGECWQDDDMREALEKMYAARALIVASPTYFGNVPGPLKNFIDRSIPTCYTGKGEAWAGAADHGTRPFKGRPPSFWWPLAAVIMKRRLPISAWCSSIMNTTLWASMPRAWLAPL